MDFFFWYNLVDSAEDKNGIRIKKEKWPFPDKGILVHHIFILIKLLLWKIIFEIIMIIG